MASYLCPNSSFVNLTRRTGVTLSVHISISSGGCFEGFLKHVLSRLLALTRISVHPSIAIGVWQAAN